MLDGFTRQFVFEFVFKKEPLLANASLHEVFNIELHYKIKSLYKSRY
jgi:hypothetical protein